MTNRKLTELAEARFKARAERAIDAPLARKQYEADQVATREKTARLRALRLARDAEERARPVEPKAPTRRIKPVPHRRAAAPSPARS
jgi:hypothetical protein